ncbi:hypothetical protein GGH91_000799 [Coemansia sp. RSA 2671]|nr:hypothetical protein LPJ60_002562 [Coemansia sp. RSA 2675]KAJ2020481.1 hypothetical protein IWW57_005001 [Coemansia sp. S610]KAJ2349473.1 hypothetical protein GGH91_000799 [Coemansia sp. RSA 2671]KAJ2700144.1 hypothetical protein H4218_002228 [Coemansia sp. IMI 209128]
MRSFVILAIISCLLALCNAARLIALQNQAGQEERYNSNDYKCHGVSSTFSGPNNQASSHGGPAMYYSDSGCRNLVFTDYWGYGAFYRVSSPIKSYRAFDIAMSTPVS